MIHWKGKIAHKGDLMGTRTQRLKKKMHEIAPGLSVLFLNMICIGLLLLVYSWIPPAPPHQPQTPWVILENVTVSEDVNFTIRVTEVRGADAPSIESVYYYVLDERRSAIPGVQGNLTDILNLDPNHNSTNISFHDNDFTENLTAGDTFRIKNTWYGGEAHGNYALLLKFKPTRDKMNGGGTVLE